MRRTIIACATVGVIAATAVSFGQDRGGPDGPFRGGGFGGRGGGREQMSAQDREAFTDARIAALHAGLKLTPDQEKTWPPVEDALRGLARQRSDAQAARRERWASMRGGPEMGDIPGQLRFMADRQAASADALRKLADASAPLYATLDDGQKRRMHVLARFLRPGGGMLHGGERGGPMRRGDSGDGGSRDFAEGRFGRGR